jgi:acetyl-CoA carboxylase carboxyltransferase component
MINLVSSLPIILHHFSPILSATVFVVWFQAKMAVMSADSKAKVTICDATLEQMEDEHQEGTQGKSSIML